MTSINQSSPNGGILSALTNAAPGNATAPAQQLGQNDFFKLLVTQLTNQSPLNPQDNSAFVAEMAQFSAASGIQQLQGSMGKMLDALAQSQNLQASALVGKQVVQPGNQIWTEIAGAGGGGAYKLSGPADSVEVLIKDARGQLVKTLPMGVQDSGMHDFAWDGTDAGGAPAPAGIYSFEVQALSGGKPQTPETYSLARVQSVLLGQGEAQLQLAGGLGQVALSQVQQIM